MDLGLDHLKRAMAQLTTKEHLVKASRGIDPATAANIQAALRFFARTGDRKMSKTALIKQYRYSPAAGGFLSFLAPVAKFVGKGLGIIKPAAAKVAAAATSPTGKAVLSAAGAGAAGALLARGSGGASGSWGPRRRGRGITARELRGYRKVARLLHNEGMVSRRARGRK